MRGFHSVMANAMPAGVLAGRHREIAQPGSAKSNYAEYIRLFSRRRNLVMKKTVPRGDFRLIRFVVMSVLTAGILVSPTYAEPTAQMKKVLDAYALLSPVPIDKTTPAIARTAPTMTTAVKAVMKKEGLEPPAFSGKTQNITIPSADGDLAARVYTPAGEGSFPVIFYIHGGGWVIADIDVYDASARALCEMTKALVISTEYRKAPEHKFPASHDDTWATYQWTLENAAKYNGNPKKVAVAGESAGGNMAASICLMAKEKNAPMPVHQLLIYPVTSSAMDTESYKENENTKPLSAKGMKWFLGYELANPSDGDNPRFSVLRSSDLKGLPPATIIAAEIDPLRSEGKAYADKLKAAGVSVTYKLYSGVTHEFFGMGAVIDEAKDAEKLASSELKRAFEKGAVDR